MWEVTLVIITCMIVSIYAYLRCSKRYHILVTKIPHKERRNIYFYETEIGFLEHIVKNHPHNLPDIIEFDRGTTYGLERRESNYYFYSNTSLGYDKDHLDVTIKDDLGFTKWFSTYVSKNHDVNSYVDVIQGSFSVNKEKITKKPKEYYENLLHSSKSQEFEEYIKLSWYYIFS